MYNEVFSELDISKRVLKPRHYGLTVLIDRGILLEYLDEYLKIYSDYIDLAKIITGTSVLLSKKDLYRKIGIYKKYDVIVFPGGMLFEYSYAKQKEENYFEAARNAGFKWIEVSNNRINISFKRKNELIRLAKENYGLLVIGETGSKKNATDMNLLIEDINKMLQNGAWRVMFEANELFTDGVFKEEIVKKLSNNVDLNKIIFELPSPRLPKITISQIYFLATWLINYFGPDVNIGNVEPGEILCLEAERLNLGSHMKL